jgi:hypothetical protein
MLVVEMMMSWSFQGLMLAMVLLAAVDRLSVVVIDNAPVAALDNSRIVVPLDSGLPVAVPVHVPVAACVAVPIAVLAVSQFDFDVPAHMPVAAVETAAVSALVALLHPLPVVGPVVLLVPQEVAASAVPIADAEPVAAP